MQHSTADVEFRASDFWQEHSAHGLLVSAYHQAKAFGFFSKVEQTLQLKMQKRRDSWADKLKTLWASVVVGCNHTVEINSRLGAHERACAALLGLERFPDQSMINRLLWAFTPEHLDQWRKLHLDLMCRHSRARRRQHWLALANRQKLLAVDFDQRALTSSSHQFELARKGYFGRKRGRFGYQLSVAFIGGGIGEVLDEYLDSGDTPMAKRMDDLLSSLEGFCRRTGIGHDQVLIRGDAQLGTAPNLAKIQRRGFHFLFKGVSRTRARKLLGQVAPEAIFWRVENGGNREAAWMCDLGVIEHRHVRRRETGEAVEARTLVMVRNLHKHLAKRAAPQRREEMKQQGQQTQREMRVDYFLTDLEEKPLPLSKVLEVYHDRSTIERYFYDEQYGLGARQIRTHHFAGEALFEFLVATTNNLLRWMQQTTFKGTELAKLGLKRLVQEAMQIPARIKQVGSKWRVEMPAEHHLVRLLLKSWDELSLAAASP